MSDDHGPGGAGPGSSAGFAGHMLLTRLGGLLVATKAVSYPALSEDFGPEPLPGSAFAQDVDEFGARVAGQIQQTCGTWHAVASEQLQAVESVHRGGQWLFSSGPLLRSSLEHLARIGWILDGYDARQRAARAWLALLVANGEDVHTHSNAGLGTPALSGAPERLEQLRDETIPSLFGADEPDCSNKQPSQWKILGSRWGTNTDVVKDLFQNRVKPLAGDGLDGRVEYRIYSMFSHPSLTGSWAFMTRAPSGGVFAPDVDHIGKRIVVNLLAFAAVTRDLYDYLGWHTEDLGEWNAHLAGVIAELAGRPN